MAIAVEHKLTKLTDPDYGTPINTISHFVQAHRQEYKSLSEESRRNHIFERLVRERRLLLNPIGRHGWAGGCPHCKNGQNDGFLNIGPEYWAVCELHGVKWLLDFHSDIDWWKEESENEWGEARLILLKFEEVDDYDRG